ncbi:MAG TPA: L-threonine 3-dehydrogenase [Chloroflexia bacterium]|nr:L-threonine 3-dehydrogenase [Chloroflexia bacterium]
MPEMMRAVVKAEAAPGAVLTQVPVPPIGPADILVRVRAASMCGTDLHIYNWDPWAQSRFHPPPMVFGHECCGDVVEVGRTVSHVAVGDFVSLESHITCGQCLQCRTGQGHVCANVQILGVDRPGVYAEYVSVPAKVAWKNPPDLPIEVASIQEPFGNAVHTVFACDIPTRRVAVIGCGPIGLWAIAIARAAGAAAVYAVDINPLRLQLAAQLGATQAINSHDRDPVAVVRQATGGEGVDVMLEMSGNARAIAQGFEMLRYGGEAALLGLPARPVELDLNNAIIFKGATVHGISGRKIWDTWYRTAGLIRSGAVDPTSVITHRLDLAEFDRAFTMMNKGEAAKVVLYP